ncbi:HPF/RaiA family ribosome-associated protein [Gimesia fumaroli]|uniref:Sigma 54 modulation protein / S30EA ribosomal protein n=1 Tax=Gimesia fumaroli TaxID=2527976 RepID=A0A518IF55_9PLAN|nr:HPF/RaiA family ribosome-associated protein [Gimesia fumaroli]QDV51731.1 Sigma 54 modulation protein / S30EA ribosomal protein [Gimesia fumaroli]
MTITFTDRNQLLTHQLKQLCQRRLDYALSRFQSMITSIEFSVSDLNGPRGGIDKACRVRIIHRNGHLIVNQKHEDLSVCISKIAEKAARTLSRYRSRSQKFNRTRHTDLIET